MTLCSDPQLLRDILAGTAFLIIGLALLATLYWGTR